jgi:hypothetical protein
MRFKRGAVSIPSDLPRKAHAHNPCFNKTPRLHGFQEIYSMRTSFSSFHPLRMESKGNALKCLSSTRRAVDHPPREAECDATRLTWPNEMLRFPDSSSTKTVVRSGVPTAHLIVPYLFLPLVWPHGPIGRLGGLRRPRPQNWPLTRDSGGRTA